MVLVRGGIWVKPHVQRAADEVVAEFGAGLAPGTYWGHSPPEGPTQALDLFNTEDTAGWELQDRVAAYLIRNAKRLGVRYVIKWNPNGNDWIWNIERAAEGWRAMATRDHRNHVHVTFYAQAEEVPDIPTKPNPINKGSVMSLVGRYVWGGLDWVFDGPSRIHAPVGDQGVLDICDKRKVDEWGAVSDSVHGWFKDVASMWGQDRD